MHKLKKKLPVILLIALVVISAYCTYSIYSFQPYMPNEEYMYQRIININGIGEKLANPIMAETVEILMEANVKNQERIDVCRNLTIVVSVLNIIIIGILSFVIFNYRLKKSEDENYEHHVATQMLVMKCGEHDE